MAFEAVALQPNIGLKICTDINTLLTDDVATQLRRLLMENGVLVFKQLNLTDEQQVALAEMMGMLRQEGDKGIYKITLDKNANARRDYLKGSFLWHIDGTHDSVPPFASLLTGITLSDQGGQTEFANSYAAYESLSPAMKNHIDKLQVVHSVEVSMRRAGIEPTDANLQFWRTFADTTHNLVWTHKSGRKSLVIGCHASHIAGMSKTEGQSLLQELLEWTTQPRFVYRHEWSTGDLLIWDNTGVLHRVEPYPLDCGRMMHRTTLLGEEPFA